MNDAAEQIAGTPPAETPSPTADELLLTFLHEFEAPCPVCGYNLKALTRPVCPECGETLVLAVGAARVRLGWLLAAVAPGFFSGIAAVFLLAPIILRLTVGDGRWSPALNVIDAFGWCSGMLAIAIVWKRHRFLALSRSAQRWWALGIWAAHFSALGVIIVLAWRYA